MGLFGFLRGKGKSLGAAQTKKFGKPIRGFSAVRLLGSGPIDQALSF
jgi:hypothetical protein